MKINIKTFLAVNGFPDEGRMADHLVDKSRYLLRAARRIASQPPARPAAPDRVQYTAWGPAEQDDPAHGDEGFL
jgi:hypothetical protein